ncbi:MAG: ATP-binding protein [Victivallales bacterium]|nr:ATP-binding protein [Victivallales bacterium]
MKDISMNRDRYLQKLLKRRGNGQIKVITGIRRCGKSYLLFNLFRNQLLEEGIPKKNIISLPLDDDEHEALRDPRALGAFLRKRIESLSGKIYILLDEIQYCHKVKRDNIDVSVVAPDDRDSLYITFYDVLNGLQRRENVDIYVTGSNSKMLSDDVLTIFRGRGDEVRIHPFSFAEYLACVGGDRTTAFQDYMTFGGMPLAVLEEDERERRNYLVRLFTTVYVKDLLEHNDIEQPWLVERLLDVLSSSVGSLTNPTKLADTIRSMTGQTIGRNTVDLYISYLKQAYLFSDAKRYDVKGKKYFETPYKLYSEDVGLRNARLNWRQQEQTHLMENMLFNELVLRGYSVDVGVVPIEAKTDGKREIRKHEIDFIVNRGFNRTYIQSAFALGTEVKEEQEYLPLRHCRDAFKKIIVTGGSERMWQDEKGIIHIGVIPFLLDESLVD